MINEGRKRRQDEKRFTRNSDERQTDELIQKDRVGATKEGMKVKRKLMKRTSEEWQKDELMQKDDV